MIRKNLLWYLKNSLRPYYIWYRAYLAKKQHRVLLKKTKTKNTIKIAFMVMYESMWKYERLYFLLKKDSRFDPVVFICPLLSYGQDVMERELQRTYEGFLKKGYNTVKTLKTDNSWLDIKGEFNPDIVFFTNPWPHTIQEYLILNFWDRLTCYVPYGFQSSNLHLLYFQTDMYKLCWKVFSESKHHKAKAEMHSHNKGENFVVTGYPGIDNLIDLKYSSPQNVWKLQEKPKKKIIWAPHHSIDGGEKKIMDQSTFLKYADLMLDIAYRFQDEIQICFKPHPNLRGTLCHSGLWGKEKTDLYYSTWESLPNGQLDEGEYLDLFLQSDAMVHDSSSFIIEYLFTNKPVMFLIKNQNVYKQFDYLGNEALKNIELGFSKEDIVEFIQNVIDDKDVLKESRCEFVRKNIMPPNNKLASENIYSFLIKQLSLSKHES